MPRKRVGGRFAKEDGQPFTPEPWPVGAPRPAFCRKFALARFAEELPQIMAVLTAKAKKGSVPHVRALLEVTGLHKTQPPKPAGQRRGKSLETILREQWKRDEEDEAARAAAREAKGNSQPGPDEGHNVS